jgi:8-oxo-dGTP diphosphatase
MEDKFSSVDIIILDKNQNILLVRRNCEPFKDKLGLVGGVQQSDENFSSCVKRIFLDKLGVDCDVSDDKIVYSGFEFNLKQIKTHFSEVSKRSGNVTLFCVEIGVESSSFLKLIESEFVCDFYNKDNLPALAFEHNKFISDFFFFEKDYTSKVSQQISLTVDIAVFTIVDGILKVLLSHRLKKPFKGNYTLPGGFLDEDLNLKNNAEKILERDVGVFGFYLEQLFTFGELDRDPRGRVLSTAYYALVDSNKVKVNFSEKYDEVKWFNVSDVSKLKVGFDHKKIIDYGMERIKNKIEYTNVAFELLPDKFTLAELQEVYEVILDKEIDKRNFRKKIFEDDLVVPLEEYKKQGRMRPAQYYKFKESKN